MPRAQLPGHPLGQVFLHAHSSTQQLTQPAQSLVQLSSAPQGLSSLLRAAFPPPSLSCLSLARNAGQPALSLMPVSLLQAAFYLDTAFREQ